MTKDSRQYVGIIPARYASRRFPGKPLAQINGRPMFWHVYRRAQQCPLLDRLVLATDDERILKAAKDLEIPAIMTRPDHPSGTDRILEAAEKIAVPESAVLVNIQGDEPTLAPQMVSELLVLFSQSSVQAATLAVEIDPQSAADPNQVKVVFGAQGRALYFSRAPIPFARDGCNPTYYGHIGLYAFRLHTLRRFVSLPRGRLEQIEKLEQLRLLENDIPLHVRITRHRTMGVDCPDDLERVRRFLQKRQTEPEAGMNSAHRPGS